MAQHLYTLDCTASAFLPRITCTSNGLKRFIPRARKVSVETVANGSTELIRTVGRTPLIIAFNSLSNEIISIIIDELGPKDLSLLLRTARRFTTILSAKFYDMAITYTRTGERPSCYGQRCTTAKPPSNPY